MPEGRQHSNIQQHRIATEINLHQELNPSNKKQQRHVPTWQENVILWICCTDFATKSLLQLMIVFFSLSLSISL